MEGFILTNFRDYKAGVHVGEEKIEIEDYFLRYCSKSGRFYLCRFFSDKVILFLSIDMFLAHSCKKIIIVLLFFLYFTQNFTVPSLRSVFCAFFSYKISY